MSDSYNALFSVRRVKFRLYALTQTEAVAGADSLRVQVRAQRFRDNDAAVGLLVIFDDRDPGASDRETATV